MQELNRAQKNVIEITNDEPTATLSDLIYLKYRKLKKENPEWSDYRIKLQLKSKLKVTIKQINAVPFFAKEKQRKNRSYKQNCLTSQIRVETQRKLVHDCHFDKNNIITKAVIGSGNVRSGNNCDQENMRPIRSAYFRSNRGMVNV